MADRIIDITDTRWMTRALCAIRVQQGVAEHEWWHPDYGEGRPGQRQAIAVCRACPGIVECATWAETHHEIGIWGGRHLARSRRTQV